MKKIGFKKSPFKWLIALLVSICIGFIIVDHSLDFKGCNLDLSKPGLMSDIVANTLVRKYQKDGTKVHAFLDHAWTQNLYTSGQELAKASAKEFSIPEEDFFKAIDEYKNINCGVKRSPKMEDLLLENSKRCNLDLRDPDQMSDIISNTLMYKYKKDGTKVRAFLDRTFAQNLYTSGQELAKASAKEFSIPEKDFFKEIDEYKNIICEIKPSPTIEDLFLLEKYKLCNIDLRNPNQMSDIIANTLIHKYQKDLSKVNAFLDHAFAQNLYATGQELASATAKEFSIPEDEFFVSIDEYKDINCETKQ